MIQPIKQKRLYIKDIQILLGYQSYNGAQRLSRKIREFYEIQYRTWLTPQELSEFMNIPVESMEGAG